MLNKRLFFYFREIHTVFRIRLPWETLVRLPIAQMLAIINVYCQNLMRQAAIIIF